MAKFRISWNAHEDCLPLSQMGETLQEIEDNLYRFFLDPANIGTLNNTYVADPDQSKHEVLKGVIKRALSKIWGDFGTWEDSSEGIRNIFQNIKRRDLKRMVKDNVKDGFSVLAGPSLDTLDWKKIEWISEHRKTIFCDTVIKKAYLKDFIPEFISTSERVPETSHLFSGLVMGYLNKSTLIASCVANPELIKQWPGDVCISTRNELYAPFFFGPSDIHSGISVSPFTIGVLKSSGVNHVNLIAQDLCYHPETNKSHSDVRHTILGYSDAQDSAFLLKHTDHWLTKSWTNKEVITTFTWDNFLRSISDTLKQNQMTCSSISPLGRRLPFARYETLDGAIESTKETYGKLTTEEAEFPFHFENFKHSIQEMIEDVESIDASEDYSPKDLVAFKSSSLFFDMMLPAIAIQQGSRYAGSNDRLIEGKSVFKNYLTKTKEFLLNELKNYLK